jgi:hypothetical protein
MGYDSYMCGRCLATGFARQAELDDHARRCAAQGHDQAPGFTDRTFTRAEVLAVVKSRRVILAERQYFEESVRELDALITIFERME